MVSLLQMKEKRAWICIKKPDDKVPHPLVKHLSSVEDVDKYPAEEGKQAAWTSEFISKGEANFNISQSLFNVELVYGKS